MRGNSTKKFLFLVDDGWRHEKKEILLHLRSHIDFEVVTHDAMTEEILSPHLPVTRIEPHPLPRNFMVSVVMFFARELRTNLVQYRKKIKVKAMPWYMQALHAGREFTGRIGLRLYSYTRAMEWLYRRSDYYADPLKGFDVLVYMPVSVRDKRLIFEARRAGLKIVNWIYSWDNPMKDNEFLTDAARYLVWNEHNRRDLEVYHGIPPDRVDLVGPVQFDYLHELDLGNLPKPEQKYVLWTCAFGQDYHLEQEVNLILHLRDILDRIAPEVQLFVRPYPFRFNIGGYARLQDVPGIRLLDFGEIRENRVVIDAEVIRERLVQIQQAECLINPGSTIGLEASFTDTPILQTHFNLPNDYPDYQDIRRAYQNEHLKYIVLPEFPNVISNPDELEQRLREILAGERDKFAPYSRRLREFSTPMGDICYKDVLGKVLAEI